MALVLVRELDGKGNYDTKAGRLCPAAPVPNPQGRPRMVRTGGDAWQPEFGKGSLLVFKPWEAVICSSGRSQENAVLGYVHTIWPTDPPVKRLDFTGRENRDVMLEYLRRHPEIAPKSPPGTAEYTLEMMALIDHFTATDAPQGKPQFLPMKFDATPAELEAQAAALKATEGAVQPGRKLGVEGGEASVAKGAQAMAEAGGEPSAVYEREFARHRAKGHSPARAAMYAERSRASSAAKAGAAEADPQAAAG